MQLEKLIRDIKYKGNPQNCEITAIAYDSRKVRKGTLFVAISGFNVDGHDYISQAISNGASAILSNGRSPNIDTIPIIQVDNPRIALSKISSYFYGNPSSGMNVIGVTGTNGKTSITHILHHIIQSSGTECGTIGTLGFKSPSGMVSTGFTTPESVEVHQMLNTLKLAQVNNIIMEISSHSLDLYRVKDVDIDIAIFSNLSEDHLDFHGNMKNYFLSKLKLFKNLQSSKTAIINIDDPYYKKICENTSANILTYGKNKNADIYPKNTSFNIDGLKTLLIYKNHEINIESQIIGEHNLYNIMAATAAAITMGISIEYIEKGLSTVPSIPGRLEHIKSNFPGKIFIDYAHTPDAYNKLFSTIKKIKKKSEKIIILFGCGGNRDKNKRSQMGALCNNFADFNYITTDNPRNELIDDINNDIVSGFKTSNYEIIIDRQEALEKALSKMDKKSILLILGKGRESYQEIGTEKLPYSDLKIIKDLDNAC